MSSIKTITEAHYTRKGIYEAITTGLREQGIEKITRSHISAADEFHVGGAAISMALANEVGLTKGADVLDVGCGIGGPARMLADEFGCAVTGIDITEDFIIAAQQLSELVGLQQLTSFIQANALDMPFGNDTFDYAWTQHVQMNIEDKKAFYSQIHRVLKPGGKFVYYDIFSVNDKPIQYPVPWANDSANSFVVTHSAIEQLLTTLGFKKISTTNRTEDGINFFKNVFDKIEKEGAPKVGLNLLVDNAPVKFKNVLLNLEEANIELYSGIYQKA